ncbi:hypothetical protein [Oceanidesulfovibrio marinus]|uniref:Uncharacterized protein n=1 Tax=Oceanidesulfovibrio marinus TaxID=370038 RepID=A0A6P1ZQB3_9BACT|nr:hypothetical protein [Oceanidesulfovibrio marinus]TVM36705.1 hypothetical protein DQK91_01940 [Oceanidesulfovibrio marinus]
MKRPVINLYKYLLIFLGLAFVYWGGKVIIVTKYYSKRYDLIMDHTNVRWPLGLALLAFGVFFLYRAYKESSKRNTSSTQLAETETICVACQTPCLIDDFEEMTCPHCGGELEPLAGFYERHPELLDEDTEPGH